MGKACNQVESFKDIRTARKLALTTRKSQLKILGHKKRESLENLILSGHTEVKRSGGAEWRVAV